MPFADPRKGFKSHINSFEMVQSTITLSGVWPTPRRAARRGAEILRHQSVRVFRVFEARNRAGCQSAVALRCDGAGAARIARCRRLWGRENRSGPRFGTGIGFRCVCRCRSARNVRSTEHRYNYACTNSLFWKERARGAPALQSSLCPGRRRRPAARFARV